MSKIKSMDSAQKIKSVHFIGIGGIGMSALARYFKAQKWSVSGSDLTSSVITKELAKEGIRVKIGHKKGNISRTLGLVVYSQAVTPLNAELRKARQLGIPVLSYPEAIGELTRKYETVAVAGAHGKSTTTALVSLMLIRAGLDPTVIIGSKLKEFGPPASGKNFRLGRGPFLVLEADEFGRSFWHYSPTFTVVTNIDKEHLDTYKNLDGVKNGFLKFMANMEPGGTLVLNRDSSSLWSLRRKIKKLSAEKKLKVIWCSLRSPVAKKVKRVIGIPGVHNISNALGAYYLGKSLKIPEEKILKAIGSYHGAWRRMEYRGRCQVSGIRCQIFDDYAHHPTEIRATLEAFREKFPKSKIICVFQPHQARRLIVLFPEFRHAFDLADITLVLPIYKVPGRDEKTTVDSRTLVRSIQKQEPKKLIFYLNNPKKIKQALGMLLSPNSHPRISASHPRGSAVIVMMGAGDIVSYTDSLIS